MNGNRVNTTSSNLFRHRVPPAACSANGFQHPRRGLRIESPRQIICCKFKKISFFRSDPAKRSGSETACRKGCRPFAEIYFVFRGMNFGKRPKALIPFHRYSAREIRTPLEEHVCEAALYTLNRGVCHIHFTLSPDTNPEWPGI